MNTSNKVFLISAVVGLMIGCLLHKADAAPDNKCVTIPHLQCTVPDHDMCICQGIVEKCFRLCGH